MHDTAAGPAHYDVLVLLPGHEALHTIINTAYKSL